MNQNTKVIIFVNEFFGAWNTPRGGYGFLARHLIPQALGLPNSNITVCLGRSRSLFKSEECITTEGIKLLKLPKLRYLAARIVNSYDLVISIEATVDFLFSLKKRLRKKILFWIQDPRPASDWQEINSVNLAKEPCYWNDKTYSLVKECYDLNLIQFATQARFLSKKAIELYHLPPNINIPFLPNPLEINASEHQEKSNNIIFLGRLDSVKRGWLFCEIAKQMPKYNFYVMGKSSNDTESNNNSIINKYRTLPNLHFLGHCEGPRKTEHLLKAKILINTSIHEALPVSFLEAFSYEVSIVSNQNPDGLVERFGIFIGSSYGDGWHDIPKFVEAVNYLMEHESERKLKAMQAKSYVKSVHSFYNFKKIFYELTNEL